MADSKDELTFDSNPVEFLKQIYDEAEKRNDTLKKDNEDNALFYQGIDKDLQDRAEDKNVARSSIFIPLLKPAIDTRIADPVTRLHERKHPVTLLPTDETADTAEREHIGNLEARLDRQFRECGYFPDGFATHLQGAEIYRTPSAVKVGWTKAPEKRAVVKERKILGLTLSRKVVFETVEVGRPYVEWLFPDEFLYQPNRSRFEDTDYVIHRMWKTPDQLRQMAREFGYDRRKVERAIEESPTGDEGTSSSMRDSTEADKGVPFENAYRDDKILVTENYVCTYAESGEEVIKRATMVANQYIVKVEKSFKGIRFPFVLITANKLPGQLEGLSSIDMGRGHQKLFNELINTHIDGITYRMFPPLLRKTGVNFTKPPRLGLARQWELPDITPEAIRPLIENPGQAPDLIPMADNVAANLRNILGAEDINQGTQANPYEKATSTKLRASYSARRASPINKRYGLAIIEIAKMFIALNQQYAEDGADWVVDVDIDVPSLTAITDPETEKQDWLMLLTTATQNPLYATPIGMRKLGNINEKMMSCFVKEGIERYVPTEDEIETNILDKAKMDAAMLEKQSLMEQMAVETQGQTGVPNGQAPQQQKAAS